MDDVEKCQVCNGTGLVSPEKLCEACAGSGEIVPSEPVADIAPEAVVEAPVEEVAPVETPVEPVAPVEDAPAEVPSEVAPASNTAEPVEPSAAPEIVPEVVS